LNQVIVSTGLLPFITKFPEGIQKIITENGKNISGGQRQRITIARALYKNADLIILDEPFNELDEESEMALLSHFKQLANAGKMVLLITHNRTSLSFCNKIISLDEE
jgi:ABC-type bacteriocin/lantibiotic exporter with double-glycine peptidase domain